MESSICHRAGNSLHPLHKYGGNLSCYQMLDFVVEVFPAGGFRIAYRWCDFRFFFKKNLQGVLSHEG